MDGKKTAPAGECAGPNLRLCGGYLFMSLTAARPRTPTPRRSMVPGSGVAVAEVAEPNSKLSATQKGPPPELVCVITMESKFSLAKP